MLMHTYEKNNKNMFWECEYVIERSYQGVDEKSKSYVSKGKVLYHADPNVIKLSNDNIQ